MRRRTLLTAGGVVAAAGALGSLAVLAEHGKPPIGVGRYGPPIPDPNGILDLPEGFSYSILERAGDAMTDGFIVPSRLDGMACFAAADDRLVLMRNSEQTGADVQTSPIPKGMDVPEEAYDPHSIGGVSRVVLDAHTLERVSSNLVLFGTERNCAGGPSPWGWLSCEESVLVRRGGQRHGYVFLCPTDAEQLLPSQPIRGYGRFNHEAVAIDPTTHIAYLTEDESDGCFYRFVPDHPAKPFTGRLQALAIADQERADTSNTRGTTFATRIPYPCRWIDVEDVDPRDDLVRRIARARGAATFSRTEGLWFHRHILWIAATDGGAAGLGQLFRYRPGGSPADPGSLELVVESHEQGILDHPDNITVAPSGDVFLVEDDYSFDDNYMRRLTPDGQLTAFARNALNPGELAGVCFSPDGRTMFVNIYEPGMTLVISGPFA